MAETKYKKEKNGTQNKTFECHVMKSSGSEHDRHRKTFTNLDFSLSVYFISIFFGLLIIAVVVELQKCCEIWYHGKL
jgi:hypothetical protein